MLTKALHLALMALFLFTFVPLASAQETSKDTRDIIGTILEVEGEASLIGTDKTPQPAAVNMPVHTGDVLVTGPASRLYVMLIDETELTLSENGQLSLDNYFFDDTNTIDNHASYSIAKGAFLYVSGLVAKKEKPEVTVNIPSGSIGIRGTRFWGGEMDGAYGVLVGDGEIEIDTGAQVKTSVKKGEGTILKGRGIVPDPAKRWSKQKIDAAVKTVALKNPTIVGQRMESEKRERQQYLRERHKINQFRTLEKIREEAEAKDPDLKGKLTRRDLLEMKKIMDSQPKTETAPAPTENKKQKNTTKREELRDKAQAKREELRDKADASRDAIRDRAETIRDNMRQEAEIKREEGSTITRPKIEPLKEVETQKTEPLRETQKQEPLEIEKPQVPNVAPIIKRTEPIAKPIIDKQP